MKQYLSLRIKESIVLFLGTLFFTKLMFLAMFGMSNVSGGGAMAAAGGVLFLVIETIVIFAVGNGIRSSRIRDSAHYLLFWGTK